jgi:hypothetical protein
MPIPVNKSSVGANLFRQLIALSCSNRRRDLLSEGGVAI